LDKLLLPPFVLLLLFHHLLLPGYKDEIGKWLPIMLGEETMASLVQLDRLFTQHNSQQLAHFININFCVNDYDMPWEHLVNMVETS
jgi:hypothetical protein